MTAILDELAPSYVGEKRIIISRSDPDAILRTFSVVSLDVDYSGLEPEGVSLPLELIISSEDTVHTRTVYYNNIPTGIAFKPIYGGPHVIRLSEVGHNLWWGSITVNVIGDRILR